MTSLNVIVGVAFIVVKDTVLVPVKFPVPVIVKEAVPALVLLVKLTV